MRYRRDVHSGRVQRNNRGGGKPRRSTRDYSTAVQRKRGGDGRDRQGCAGSPLCACSLRWLQVVVAWVFAFCFCLCCCPLLLPHTHVHTHTYTHTYLVLVLVGSSTQQRRIAAPASKYPPCAGRTYVTAPRVYHLTHGPTTSGRSHGPSMAHTSSTSASSGKPMLSAEQRAQLVSLWNERILPLLHRRETYIASALALLLFFAGPLL
jgi:hypothetical protein